MTLTAVNPPFAFAARQKDQGLRILPVLLVTLLGVLAISAPNLLDPMIRHDDYPALFAEASGFWDKTLHEGRWLNYVWHLRGVVTPSWLNFAVYQALWAVFAASVAVAALGRGGSTWFTCVLALMIIIAPPASLISLWFNTLIPGLAIVALYAVLACQLSVRAHRALLPVFVVASFMAYTTYPLLLLAICLARSERRSIADLFGLLALFAGSFVLAVALTYSLNWLVHGVFGVPLADWRAANPAADIAGMVQNIPLVAKSFGDFITRSSFEFFPASVFHLGLLALSSLVLLRRAPLEVTYLWAGLLMGFALLIVQIVKIGAIVPPRAFIFAWVFYAIIVVRAAQILTGKPGIAGRLARNFVLLVVGSYLLQTFQQYMSYRPWQAETRQIAELTSAVDGPVYLEGDVLQMRAAQGAFVQKSAALNSRMKQLNGRQIILCQTDVQACDAISSSAQRDHSAKLTVDKTSGMTQFVLIKD